MQKKLTLVDITVDNSIGLRYKLAKQIYITYTDDFEFARLYKHIDYDPNNSSWQELRQIDSAKYWRQGFPLGLLDNIIETLIKKDERGNESVISFGEFEKIAEQINNNKKSDLHLSRDIFYIFHPQNRPILWRILITQVVILQTLLDLRNYDSNSINDKLVKDLLFKPRNMNEFAWADDRNLILETEEPFNVAKEYLKIRF